MRANAGLVFKNNSLPENYKVFDGSSGKSITLEELARSRATEQIHKFQDNSSFTDFLRRQREKTWKIILGKLKDLFNAEYDEDFLEPSPHILKTVAEFLAEATSDFTSGMPLPTFVVADGEGGVKIEWKMNDKHLRLSYSPHRNYLYWEYDSVPDGIENFNAAQLIESLKWLKQSE